MVVRPRLLAAVLLLQAAAAVPEGLQEALQDIVVRTSAKYNCSYSISYRDKGGAASAAFGTIDWSTGKQAKTTDAYPFGSVTKMLTGASILKLASQGRLSLDDPVAPIVDPMLARMAKERPEQGFTSMADLWGAENVTGVTIRQLLSMKSGIPDFDTATPCDPKARHCEYKDPLRATLYGDPAHSYTPTELMGVPWVRGHFRPCDKGFFPGMPPFCYSSTNFMLLGMVLAIKAPGSDKASGSLEAFDQGKYLPPSLRNGDIAFAVSGGPSDFTEVHGYDRTSYNVPEGRQADHDNWKVDGVFSGWTASDIVATTSAVANLTWELFGPPSSVAPKEYVELMRPRGLLSIYGLAAFNLGSNTGHRGKYGVAYGHLGATYGYQSITAYMPELQVAITVATNIETNQQRQPAEALCFAYNKAASLILKREIKCQFVDGGGFYGGGCKCDPIEDEDLEPVEIVV